MMVKVPHDAPALFEKKVPEFLYGHFNRLREGPESGRKEVNTKDT